MGNSRGLFKRTPKDQQAPRSLDNNNGPADTSRAMGLLEIPYPVIDPVALRLGPLAVRWYGLAYMAGLLLGWLYIKYLLRRDRFWPGGRRPFEPDKADDLLLYMTIGVLVGGRVGQVLFYEPAYYLRHPLEILAVWRGGMAFHGGLVGAAIATILFARRMGANVWTVMDLSSAAVPMGLFFGRLANFINAELWGRPSSVPWAMAFPGAGPVPRHPSQLYEAALEGVVLFAVLWWLTHYRSALRRPGLVAGAFLIGYGLARSFCELFREPEVEHILNIGPVTAGIVYCLPMIAIGVYLVRAALRRAPAAADAGR